MKQMDEAADAAREKARQIHEAFSSMDTTMAQARTALNRQKVLQMQQDANAELNAVLDTMAYKAVYTPPQALTKPHTLAQMLVEQKALDNQNGLAQKSEVEALRRAQQQQLDQLTKMEQKRAWMQSLIQPPLMTHGATAQQQLSNYYQNSLGGSVFDQGLSQSSRKTSQAPAPAPVKKYQPNLPRAFDFEA